MRNEISQAVEDCDVLVEGAVLASYFEPGMQAAHVAEVEYGTIEQSGYKYLLLAPLEPYTHEWRQYGLPEEINA